MLAHVLLCARWSCVCVSCCSGQSCIAPDYVFVPRKLKAAFTAACVAQISLFYPNNSVSTNPDFGRIVNERHTTRLAKVIDASKADIVAGGKYDVESKFIEPTVLAATVDSPAMQEEIFGPILPIIEYDDVSTVIDYINSKHKPLSLYIFSTNSAFQQRILSSTSSGGVSINDVMMHFANAAMPFGGVGNSGVGNYHGKFGFETFSHAKAVLHKSVYGDAPARYPPYTAGNAKLFRFVSELYKVNSATFSKMFKFIVLPVTIIARQHLSRTRQRNAERRVARGDETEAEAHLCLFAAVCALSSFCSWWWPSSLSARVSPSASSPSSKRVHQAAPLVLLRAAAPSRSALLFSSWIAAPWQRWLFFASLPFLCSSRESCHRASPPSPARPKLSPSHFLTPLGISTIVLAECNDSV